MVWRGLGELFQRHLRIPLLLRKDWLNWRVLVIWNPTRLTPGINPTNPKCGLLSLKTNTCQNLLWNPTLQTPSKEKSYEVILGNDLLKKALLSKEKSYPVFLTKRDWQWIKFISKTQNSTNRNLKEISRTAQNSTNRNLKEISRTEWIFLSNPGTPGNKRPKIN